MASKPITHILLLLCFLFLSTTLSTATSSIDTNHSIGLNTNMLSKTLFHKGYLAMSLVLELTLKTLIPFETTQNTTFTIFCSSDTAFSSSKYPQPPLTLLQYHVVQLKIDREIMEFSLPLKTKVDTLLPGHPLVVTSLPNNNNGNNGSINEVKIREWDVYNDGRLIIHGVEDFFDPGFQTLLYPWYDGGVITNNGKISTGRSDNGGVSRVKEVVMERNIDFLRPFAIGSLFLAFAYVLSCNIRDGGYV